jgi:hypothetical protein
MIGYGFIFKPGPPNRLSSPIGIKSVRPNPLANFALPELNQEKGDNMSNVIGDVASSHGKKTIIFAFFHGVSVRYIRKLIGNLLIPPFIY